MIIDHEFYGIMFYNVFSTPALQESCLFCIFGAGFRNVSRRGSSRFIAIRLIGLPYITVELGWPTQLRLLTPAFSCHLVSGMRIFTLQEFNSESLGMGRL